MMSMLDSLTIGVYLLLGSYMIQWVAVRYESLPDFCYLCGRLDHVERDCPKPYSDLSFMSRRRIYRQWLRVSAARPNRPRAFRRANERLVFREEVPGNQPPLHTTLTTVPGNLIVIQLSSLGNQQELRSESNTRPGSTSVHVEI